MQRSLRYAVAAMSLVIGTLATFAILRPEAARPKFEAVDITGVPWGKGFDLTGHNGRRRTLEDFRGKVVTLFFGFTHCPDMCPTALAMLADAMRRLGRDADQVQGLFVTVDPKRDTPQVLSRFVPAFYPTFLGLLGDEEAIARTASEFKVYYKAQPPNEQGSYTVDHSGQIFVFDRKGRLRLFLRPHSTPESVARDVRALLEESSG